MDRGETAGAGVVHPFRSALREGSEIPWILFLFAAGCLTYANSFPGAFLGDDELLVLRNPLLEPLRLWEVLRSDYWGPGTNSGLHRPLTILSFWLARSLWGEAVWGHHLLNVVLHGGVAALALPAAAALGFPRTLVLPAALLFAVHPIHTESVNIVSGRAELLAALFALASLGAVRRGSMGAWPAALLLLPALLSKESAVVVPALLAAALLFARRPPSPADPGWRALLLQAAVVGLWLAFRHFGLSSRGIPPSSIPAPFENPLAGLGFLERLPGVARIHFLYLRELLWPARLWAIVPGSVLGGGAAPPGGALHLAAAAGGGALLLLGWRRRHPAALAGVLYALSFAVTGNVLFTTQVLMAGRFAYLPSWPFCLAAVSLAGLPLAFLPPRLRRGAGLALVTLAAVSLAGRTMVRNRDYADAVRLFSRETRLAPDNTHAWVFLAQALARRGDDIGADAAHLRGVASAPDHAGARIARGYFLLERGRAAEAAAEFREASARAVGMVEPWAILGLAAALLAEGRAEEAGLALEAVPLSFRRRPEFADLAAAAGWGGPPGGDAGGLSGDRPP